MGRAMVDWDVTGRGRNGIPGIDEVLLLTVLNPSKRLKFGNFLGADSIKRKLLPKEKEQDVLDRLVEEAYLIKNRFSKPHVVVIGGSSVSNTASDFAYLAAQILCEHLISGGTVFNCGRGGISTIFSIVGSQIFQKETPKKVVSLLPRNTRSIMLVTEVGIEKIGNDVNERDIGLVFVADYILSICGRRGYVPKVTSFPEDIDTTENQLKFACDYIEARHKPNLILFPDTGGVTEFYAKKIRNKYSSTEKRVDEGKYVYGPSNGEITIAYGLDENSIKRALCDII